jgi:trans-aconitate methyltransferase
MAKSQYKDIVKGVDSVSINILDNGYNLEFTGYNSKGDWVTSKIIVPSVEELCNHIKEVTQIPHD